MIEERLGRRYARALGELARDRGVLERVESDLKQVHEAFASSPEFLERFRDRRVPPVEKRRLLAKAFGDGLTNLTLHFLYLVVAKRREAYLSAMIQAFSAYADEVRGIVEVEVRTARSLDAELADGLRTRLGTVLGKSVRLREAVDPSLLGGVVVRVGDLRIDGSAARRLQRLGEQMQRARLN